MSLRRLSDGRYVIRYYRNGTKQGPRVQEDLGRIPHGDAQRIYKQRLSAAAQRRGETSHRITFETLADEYLEIHGPNMAERSLARVADTLRLHLKPAFGSMLVESMKPVHIEQYRQKRLTEGKAAPATVNREWAILKAVLNRGEAWGRIERNPIARGRVKVLPVDNGRLIYFEPEEWNSFITAFDDGERWRRYATKMRTFGPVVFKAGCEPRRHGGGRKPDSEATDAYFSRLRAAVPVFKALLFTGSRLGEILALRWDDVDLKRGVITIRQRKTRKPKSPPISGALRAVLASLRPGVGQAYVFVRPDGAPFYEVEIQRAFGVAKRLSGIRKELTPHSLRHTFASWLAIKGTPLRTIQELLGHADIRMTIRYAHLSPSHLKDAVEAIEAMAGAANG